MGMIVRSPSMLTAEEILQPKIFLAGGISDCPDWQSAIGNRIAEETDLIVINPRRKNWATDSQSKESVEQIYWEHFYLSRSEVILFWFPEETLCPITLFELGAALRTESDVIIGMHPGYKRRLDVKVQSKLVRPDIKLYDSLNALVNSVIDEYKTD